MSEKQTLQAAVRRLEITAAQVLSWRVYKNEIVLVVDRGVAGCPKYRLPLSELVVPESETEPAPASEPEPEPTPAPKPRKATAKGGV